MHEACHRWLTDIEAGTIRTTDEVRLTTCMAVDHHHRQIITLEVARRHRCNVVVLHHEVTWALLEEGSVIEIFLIFV